MEIFNIVCGACSIAGLLVSIFTASKVIKISQAFICNNRDVNLDAINEEYGNNYYAPSAGRDINVFGNRE